MTRNACDPPVQPGPPTEGGDVISDLAPLPRVVDPRGVPVPAAGAAP